MAVAAGQPAVGTVLLLCFCGLFRVGELLGLLGKDVFETKREVIFILGVAKRGIEQRVVAIRPSKQHVTR